ncbi:MAG: homoserine dehydrogenase [Candidatus Tectomicrobia bacterium]|uniref:Homoserine dehydrogenase n=1 Tax=Tectimicrobiota bacterium TaxID=2528274 RepID=A0A932CP79_UNCTE|nr:homoserine dehydrogenase [Candidatus Tectomicrobia bacterium]
MRPIYVGIIGLGTVGTGTVRILQENARTIEARLGTPMRVKRIADIDLERDRGILLEPGVLTPRAADVLDDPEIDIVVELMGGLEPARRFLLQALENGKHVVTANKALLAHHGEEIYRLARERSLDVGFEASVGGGIPIIRALREGFAANQIQSVYGIVNGTSNYILSKMTDEGGDFAQVLAEAQRMGYAEQDPSFDVQGTDSAHKLTILASLALGTPVAFSSVYTEGITQITPLDIQYARQLGYRIKLLAIAKRLDEEIEVRVHPTLIPQEDPLANINGVLNAIYVVGNAVGKNLFVGRGAGDLPTGSAVVGDLLEIGRNILRGGGGRVPPLGFAHRDVVEVRIRDLSNLGSEYYLRFSVVDKPGVLSQISGILGKYSISIASVLQKERGPGEAVPVVMMTHEAQERDVQAALREIDQLDVILDRTNLVRVEQAF